MIKKLSKIAITESANKSLTKMLETLNKTSKTKIKKQELTSWIIVNYQKTYFAKHIDRIVKEAQNPLSYAKALMRELGSSKNLSTIKEIQSVLKHL